MAEVYEGLDMLYMPSDMRRDFCLDLLESVGAEKISVNEKRSEITHCCLAPWHNETHPSASLNWDVMGVNCFSCPAQGGILWLIGLTQDIYGPEAREWLSSKTGMGGTEFHLAPLLKFLDAVEAQRDKSSAPPPMPRFSEKMLEPWLEHIYPGLTTGVEDLGIVGRGLPEANLREAKIGWDMDANRVIIPHFWRGDLVGWQARRILESDSEKYKSTGEFPRDRTLYRMPTGKKVVVVESPMSVLQHMHHLPITATFGSEITDEQMNWLRFFPEIVFFPDPDPAGWSTVMGHWSPKGEYTPSVAERLTAYSNVKVTNSDWFADAQQLGEDVVTDLVDNAEPLALWERPTGALRCLTCKERHGGHCAT